MLGNDFVNYSTLKIYDGTWCYKLGLISLSCRNAAKRIRNDLEKK